MSFSQNPLPLLHPPFHPGVNPVPCSSCQIVSTLEERGGMPGKGGIIASVDGQLALSKREVGVQKTTVTFVASPSAETDKTRIPVCFPICWSFCTIPLETCGTCCTSVRGCTEVIASRLENVQRPVLSPGLLLHFK